MREYADFTNFTLIQQCGPADLNKIVKAAGTLNLLSGNIPGI
jgi:hypothetical protein